MKAIWRFIRTTLLGGLLVVLPIYVMVLLLLKAAQGLMALFAPLANALPLPPEHQGVLTAVFLLLVCFIAGLVFRTELGRRAFQAFEARFIARIPGYTLVRDIAHSSFGAKSGEFDVALVEIEDALVPAWVVERHADGRLTVFVPSSPTPFNGAVYVLPPERVHVVDVPFVQLFQSVTRWGTGTRELVAALEARKGRQELVE
jgi:uncharacterized membrane protein